MNTRLKQLLESIKEKDVKHTCLLDTYNQTIYTDIAPTISTRVDASNNTYIMKVMQVGNLVDDSNRKFKNPQTGRVYSMEGLAPCLTCMEGGQMEPNIMENHGTVTAIRIPQATKQGYIEVEQGGVFDAAYPESTTRRGRVQEGGKVAPTLLTSNELCVYEGVEYKGKKFLEGSGLYTCALDRFQRDGLKDMSRCLKAGISDAGVVQNFRIRKLTPRECFRLMGVSEENIDKIQAAGISNSQQYKLAGNSIVVDTLYYIFKKMFVDKENENEQLTLF